MRFLIVLKKFVSKEQRSPNLRFLVGRVTQLETEELYILKDD